MPADVNLFDMLRGGVLESMDMTRLLAELDRALRMQARVAEYTGVILDVLKSKAS